MIFCPQFANSPRNFCHLRQLTECNIHPTPYTTFNTLFTFSCPRLCSGTVAGQDIGQGISTLRYRDRICRSRLKVQVFTNPHKIFLFFTFFFFLRCLSGYLFFAENHIKFWIIIRNSKKICTFKKVMYLCSPIRRES